MKFQGIHHVGVAVRDLEKSLAAWSAWFGARPGPVEENVERGVRLALLQFAEGPVVELISPLDERSSVARFLENRGEGIHHFALDVDDIEAAVAELKKGGLELVFEEPQSGMGGSRITFVLPRSLNGVLLEIRETRKPG